MTAWVSLPSTDTDADSPGDIDLATKLIQRNQHLFEFYTAGVRTSDRIPHDHSGNGDAVTHAVSSHNLLIDACVNAYSTESHWSGSGFARDATTGAMSGGTADTHYMYQDLLDPEAGSYSGADAFGSNGAPMVGSVFLKASNTLSQGTMYLGISDGSTSTFDTGHRWSLPYTSITTSWQRFWFYSDDSSPATAWPGAGYSNSVRFLIAIASGDAFDRALHVSGCMLCTSQGTLTQFGWTPAEKQADGYGDENANSIPNTVPLFDTTVSMTNAVELTTRA